MRTEATDQIYKAMALVMLTLATETRTETKKTKQQMGTTELRVLRSIISITLRGMQTNNPRRIPECPKYNKTRKRNGKSM